MKIGLDIDGVIANFVATFIPLVRERYSLSLRQRDIYVHDLYLVLGITQHDAMQLIRETICCDPKPYPGAVQGLATLHKAHEVTLVTARPEDLMDVTKAWLARQGIEYHHLLHLEEGLKHTHEYAFDVFVDDHLKEAFGFIGKIPHIIIFDRPWNRTFNLAGLFQRAHSWRELASIIERSEGRG